MASYPPELQKKVTLLQHFKSYLEGDKGPGVNIYYYHYINLYNYNRKMLAM